MILSTKTTILKHYCITPCYNRNLTIFFKTKHIEATNGTFFVQKNRQQNFLKDNLLNFKEQNPLQVINGKGKKAYYQSFEKIAKKSSRQTRNIRILQSLSKFQKV